MRQDKSMKYLQISLLVFLSIIGLSFVVSAQPIIDSDVEEALNNSKWVKVSVILNSIGNVSVNQEVQSQIISNFTDLEFLLERLDSRGRSFWGNITREGLEKLRNNDNVLRVHLPIEGGTILILGGINGSNNTFLQTNANKNIRPNIIEIGIILICVAMLVLIVIHLKRGQST